jgi:hypothetical protein
MLDELRRGGVLYQQTVVADIVSRFGEQFVYDNEAGNPAIDKAVLAAFTKASGNDVVWVRAERLWRFREKGDEPGRMQP